MLFGDEILCSQFSWIFYEGGIFINIIQLFEIDLYKSNVTISVLSFSWWFSKFTIFLGCPFTMSFRRPPWQVQIFQSCKLQARKTTHVLLPTIYFLLCLEIVTGIVTMFILTSNILSVVCYWYFAKFQISTSVPLDIYVKGAK